MDKYSVLKMSVCGNDYIIIDNRKNGFAAPEYENTAIQVCTRKHSIGADGIIFVENSEEADFKISHLNSDGSVVEFGSNALCCAARWAIENKIVSKSEVTIETIIGNANTKTTESGIVLMHPGFSDLKVDQTLEIPHKLDTKFIKASIVNLGVLHAVIETENVRMFDIVGVGRVLRDHQEFKPDGANVTFYDVIDNHHMNSLTFERGVDTITGSCGGGAIAAAVISFKKGNIASPVSINYPGGAAKVSFDNELKEISLEVKPRIVVNGIFTKEAMDYMVNK